MVSHALPSPDSTSPAQRFQGAILCITILVAPLVFSFHLDSFLDAKRAVIGLALVALASVGLFERKSLLPGLRALWPLWLLLLLSTARLMSPFSSEPSAGSAIQALAHAALLLALSAFAYSVMLQPSWRPRVSTAIVLSSGAAGLLGMTQFFDLVPCLFPSVPGYDQRVYSVFGNQDLLGGYLALGLPLCVALALRAQRRRWIWIALSALITASLMISASRTAWLAAAVGIAVLLVLKRDRVNLRSAGPTLILCLAVTVVSCLLAPEATVGRISHSFSESDIGYRSRLWIWDGGVRMGLDNPLVGVGVGNYAYWSPHYQGVALRGDYGNRHYRNEVHTLHAHSDPLELFAETGFVGVLCAVMMLWRMRKCRGTEWGGLAALLTSAAFNATWLSPAHALCGLLLVQAMLAGDAVESNALPTDRRTQGIALAGALAVVCLVMAASILPSWRLRAATRSYENGAANEMLYRRAADPRAREAWAMVLMTQGRTDEARPYLERARLGLDTGRIHYLLARAHVESGDLDAARTEYRKCIWRWPSYPEAWRELASITPPEYLQDLNREASEWLGLEPGLGLLD